MNTAHFFEQLEAIIAKYDLLCHPFYKAWAAGELTRDDLREYASEYYHHVEAFPQYLAEFALRLEESDLRRAVLANMCDENGTADRSMGKSRCLRVGRGSRLRRRAQHFRRGARRLIRRPAWRAFRFQMKFLCRR
jgi:pyrroloquinoline quinone (PQQ) biosynthesis protein C